MGGERGALEELDRWYVRQFGHPLSGRMYELEIQPLVDGNTKHRDQIRTWYSMFPLSRRCISFRRGIPTDDLQLCTGNY
jgi:hypothetical protein